MPRRKADVVIDADGQRMQERVTLDIGAEVRVSRLHSLISVRAEVGRLYREARKREGRFPDALTALRLSTILNTVTTAIEIAEHEKQIQELRVELERLKGAGNVPRLAYQRA